MSLELLEKLIDEDFGYSYSGNWGKSLEHSSLVVDRVKEVWYWNSQNISGKVRDYLLKIRGLSEKQASELLNSTSKLTPAFTDEEPISTPYEKLVDYLWIEGKNNRSYWYKRCLTDDIIDRFRLGVYEDWYTIPIYLDGQFRNFQCRKDIPEKKIRPWYIGVGPLLFNGDILKFVSTVFITEGPVDAILLAQYGFPSISHTAGAEGWNQEWFKYFTGIKQIYYIADNDKAGIAGAVKVVKSLGETKVKTIRFSDKAEKYDTVDFFRDGGTVEEFKQRILSAKYLCEGV